jgi:1-deoxy-D-xylulose-5-phosphate synthase
MKDIIFSSPEGFKQMSMADLKGLALTIREFLIESISKTGGHIGANLGVVELTIALHYVFTSPHDRLIFDTGHQGYTHKLLTGREALFQTLNQWGGMDRFVARKESVHDVIDASHAGTSISIASGIARALAGENSPHHVVAVIGDGSMGEGIAFEGLNYVAGSNLRLIVVLNDNGMAIAPNVGGIKNLTGGENWQAQSGAFFRGMGYAYFAVSDGHDIEALVVALNEAKKLSSPVLVHVKTEKGRGLPCAKNHPYKMHFSMPFDSETGAGASPTVTGRTYAVAASEALEDILRKDPAVFVMTPATPYASALDNLLTEFPDRVIDVGMAEQHAVTMACGLALEGKKPVVCFQSTFMQRAFDQLLHDACYMNLPVTFLGVRSGFAGYDAPTHHGLYDIPYLRSLPNMQVIYPLDSMDLKAFIARRMESPAGPMAILYPYEPIPQPEPDAGTRMPEGVSIAAQGCNGVILCLGNQLTSAHRLREALSRMYQQDFGIACVRNIKPFPHKQVVEMCAPVGRIVTLEESTLPGGFGSLICETLSDSGINASVLRMGVLDRFVPAGSKDECSNVCGLTPDQIILQMLKRWPDIGGKENFVS